MAESNPELIIIESPTLDKIIDVKSGRKPRIVNYPLAVGSKFESDQDGEFMLSDWSKEDNLFHLKYENKESEILTEKEIVRKFATQSIKKLGERKNSTPINISNFEDLPNEFIKKLDEDNRILGVLTDKKQVYWAMGDTLVEQLKLDAVLLDREVTVDFEYSPTGETFYINGSSEEAKLLLDKFMQSGVARSMPVIARLDGEKLSRSTFFGLSSRLEGQRVKEKAF